MGKWAPKMEKDLEMSLNLYNMGKGYDEFYRSVLNEMEGKC